MRLIEYMIRNLRKLPTVLKQKLGTDHCITHDYMEKLKKSMSKVRQGLLLRGHFLSLQSKLFKVNQLTVK